MEKVKDEVVVKCVRCSAEMLTGQRFCTECGAEQDAVVKTTEEIAAMRKRIHKVKHPDPKNMLMSLMMILLVDSAFGWVMGEMNDEKLVDMLTAPETEGGEEVSD
tara:strand:- start:87 stop:401 length:315 start_codon:yes stop_codon:yes gene_type:complete